MALSSLQVSIFLCGKIVDYNEDKNVSYSELLAKCCFSLLCSKTALLEGLEIDQYIWGILHSLANTDFEEVTIEQTASWKPVTGKQIKEEENGMSTTSFLLKIS